MMVRTFSIKPEIDGLLLRRPELSGCIGDVVSSWFRSGLCNVVVSDFRFYDGYKVSLKFSFADGDRPLKFVDFDKFVAFGLDFVL